MPKVKFNEEERQLFNAITGNDFQFENLDIYYLQNYTSRNGLSQYLYFQLSKRHYSIPLQLSNHIKSNYLSTLVKNTKIQAVWKELYDLSIKNNLDIIPLKGIFLANHIYPDISTRPMSDLDILFPNNQANNAFDLIIQNGGVVCIEEGSEQDKKTGHHLPGIIYKGVLIEVHRSLLPLDVSYQIPTELIWETKTNYNNQNVLQPALNLIYLCLHTYYTFLRGGVRICWFLDLILLVKSEYFNDNGKKVIELIEQLKVKQPVLKMLAYAEFIFNFNFDFIPYQLKYKLLNKEILQLIKYSQQKGEPDSNAGYIIAIERLKNTPGLKNKWHFILSFINVKKTGQKTPLKRVIVISSRLISMLFNKLFKKN